MSLKRALVMDDNKNSCTSIKTCLKIKYRGIHVDIILAKSKKDLHPKIDNPYDLYVVDGLDGHWVEVVENIRAVHADANIALCSNKDLSREAGELKVRFVPKMQATKLL